MNNSLSYRGGCLALSLWLFTGTAIAQHTISPDNSPLPSVRNEAIGIDVLPGAVLPIGAKASFRISAKQAGYLIVLDVNAAGKVRQIYPDADYLLGSGATSFSNRVKPGQIITIPEAGNPYTGFVFVVSPPAGIAMAVAILCDQPVQLLDLPDVPPSRVGRMEAFTYLADATRSLQLTAGGSHRVAPMWSFSAVFYRVE